MKGKHLSQEHKANLSAAARAAWSHPEYREKHRAAMSHPEVREEISNAGKGRHQSPETRAKRGAAVRAAMSRPEVRERMRASHLGNHLSLEAREKLRQANLGKPGHPCSPEHREKLRAAILGKHHTLEARGRMRVAQGGERNPQWRGGVSFEPYCPKFNNDFKERVRAFWGRTCCLCLAPENGQRLSVHHVHANKEACCDERSLRQFVALCADCHSKAGGKGARAEEYRVHFQEMIALRGGRSY